MGIKIVIKPKKKENDSIVIIYCQIHWSFLNQSKKLMSGVVLEMHLQSNLFKKKDVLVMTTWDAN